MEDELIERVARAIAAEIGRQDHDEVFVLPDDLKLAWLDQGEVDFALVAKAAIAAARCLEDGERAVAGENVRGEPA